MDTRFPEFSKENISNKRSKDNNFLFSRITLYGWGTVFCDTTQYIQGVSRLVDITAGGDFLGFFDQKSSYKHVSDFGWLQSYGQFFNSRTRPCVNRVLRNQLAGDVLSLVAYHLRKLQRAFHAVRN